MLHELAFDVVLTGGPSPNRLLHEFSRDHPDFRRRLQDLRYTASTAWLIVNVEGLPATLAAFDELDRRGYPATETRELARGPRFRLVYEQHELPPESIGKTVWAIAAKTLGLDARIAFTTEGGRSRVTVQHEDRSRLARFLDELRGDDPAHEVRLVRIGPVGMRTPPDVGPEDRALLAEAWAAGYYDRPRRTTIRDLGQRLCVPYTTVGYRLRKLETLAVAGLVEKLGIEQRAADEAQRPRR